ncbi:O-methyltransferase [Roseivirga sp. BDSF3-8]|uniref:O-methyltransferase n=1 Tax=Roseivirga sp. BDSF3-8 TaxID=3241598 RepID=UPI0035320E23
MFDPAYRFLWHWLHRVDAHSLHSPLFFQFYNKVIRPKKVRPLPETVDSLIVQAKKDGRIINRNDLGAGSKAHGNEVTVATLAKNSTSTRPVRQLLLNLTCWLNSDTILELGTSLGFSALTMASARPEANLFTVEGCPQTAAIAQENFSKAAVSTIDLHVGNIDDILPDILDQAGQIDLAYLDANHQYAPTLSYFDMIRPYLHSGSVVVIGDISWSKEMQRAWQEIKSRPEATATADLLDVGVVFITPLPYRLSYAMAMPRASVAR